MAIKAPRAFLLFLFIPLSFFHFTCGIMSDYYLEQVPLRYVSRGMNFVRVYLPGVVRSDYPNFINYTIFYRLYLSETHMDVSIEPIKEILSSINSDLWSDYNSIYSSTDPTLATNNSINFFSGRFYELEYEDSNGKISGGSSVFPGLDDSGATFEIWFPATPGEHPTITNINSERKYTLKRSSNLDKPEPNYNFINSVELSDNTKATPSSNDINIDVRGKSNLPEGQQVYTYISLYVIATGKNPELFTLMYSKPTFLDIFKLPES